MPVIHRTGTPENDSEARAIKRFVNDLPNDCDVFHNLEVTTGRGRSKAIVRHLKDLFEHAQVPRLHSALEPFHSLH